MKRNTYSVFIAGAFDKPLMKFKMHEYNPSYKAILDVWDKWQFSNKDLKA